LNPAFVFGRNGGFDHATCAGRENTSSCSQLWYKWHVNNSVQISSDKLGSISSQTTVDLLRYSSVRREYAWKSPDFFWSIARSSQQYKALHFFLVHLNTDSEPEINILQLFPPIKSAANLRMESKDVPLLPMDLMPNTPDCDPHNYQTPDAKVCRNIDY